MKKIILNTVLISILLASLVPCSVLATTVNEFFTKTGTIIEIPLSLGSIIDQEGNKVPSGSFIFQEYISWYQKIFEKLLKILGISNESKHIFSISANDNNTEFLIKEKDDNYKKASFSNLKIGDDIIVEGRYWTTYGTDPPPKNTNLQHHHSAEKVIIK